MTRQPLLIMLLCFILGIIFQDYFFCSNIFVYSLVIIPFVFAALSYSKIKLFLKLRNIFLGVLFFALGLLGHLLNFNKNPFITIDSKMSSIVFKLDKKLNSNIKNRRYQIEILSLKSGDFSTHNSFKSILSIPKDQPELDFQHYYSGKAYVNPVSAPAQSFLFNYKKYLERQDVFYQSYVPSGLTLSKRLDMGFSEKIKQKRLDVLWRINNSKLDLRQKEFLKGIILADRTDMDEVTVRDFNQSGLVHFLAISGSHMVIIFWIILLVLKPIFKLKLRKLSIVIALVLIWIFAIFIDYGSSVVRSCIMISMYYVVGLLQRKTSLLHSLAVSAFVILIWDSNQIFDLGFQLSYLAVFGIYWLNPVFLKLFRKPKYFLEKLLYNIVSISLSAQLATLPLVLYYFHQFSLVSIVANLVVLPFSEIIIVFSLLMVILFSFNIEFSILNLIYDYLINILLEVIHFFAEQNYLMLENIGFSFLEVIVLLLTVYYLGVLVRRYNYGNVLNFGIVLCTFFLLRLGFNVYNRETDEVLFFTHFKDDIVVIKNKEEVLFIIDESAKLQNIEKSIIKPYLANRRLKHYNVMTRPYNTKSFYYKGVLYKKDKLNDN